MQFKDLGSWVPRHHKASCCFLPELNGPHVPREPASMPEACTEHNRQTPLGISSSPISSPCSTSGPARPLQREASRCKGRSWETEPPLLSLAIAVQPLLVSRHSGSAASFSCSGQPPLLSPAGPELS